MSLRSLSRRRWSLPFGEQLGSKPFILLAIAVLIFEACLCIYIVRSDPVYSWDLPTYYQQVDRGLTLGEKDYAKIEGRTGPLVYPAGHLYMYWLVFAGTVTIREIDDPPSPPNAGTHQKDLDLSANTPISAQAATAAQAETKEAAAASTSHHHLGSPLAQTQGDGDADRPPLPPQEELKKKKRLLIDFDLPLTSFVFGCLYLVNLVVVLAIYRCADCFPDWFVFLLIISRRVHNIFVLGYYNDTICTTLVHVSILLFMHKKWLLGCVMFSLAVSVKMNIMLFAPGLLVLLLHTGGWRGALKHIAVCAVVQVLVGIPFLIGGTSTDGVVVPMSQAVRSYVTRSFDLSRTFDQAQSINFQFLPTWWFQSHRHGMLLLLANLALWLLFFVKKWSFSPSPSPSRLPHSSLSSSSSLSAAALSPSSFPPSLSTTTPTSVSSVTYRNTASSRNSPTFSPSIITEEPSFLHHNQRDDLLTGHSDSSFAYTSSSSSLHPLQIAMCLFVSNVIGVCVARSLHYQFFVWYWFSIPLLIWNARSLPHLLQLVLFVSFIYAWEVRPSTPGSSLLLQTCHAVLLLALWRTKNLFNCVGWKGLLVCPTSGLADPLSSSVTIGSRLYDAFMVNASARMTAQRLFVSAAKITVTVLACVWFLLKVMH